MKKFKPANIRLYVQILYTILTNGYVFGFLNGKIYKGALKSVCVPGLNCYSCPGALASCPLGAFSLCSEVSLAALSAAGSARSVFCKIYCTKFLYFANVSNCRVILS